jgi:hypothetical protein
MPGDPGAGFLGDPDRRGGVDVGQHQHVLFAAVPCAEPARGQAFRQQVGDLPQHAPADQVPDGVVDLFEEVEVDERDGDYGRPRRSPSKPWSRWSR